MERLSRDPAMRSGELVPVCRLITESCARMLAVERVGVWLFDETETELRCLDQFNLSSGAHTAGAVLHEHEFRSEFGYLKTCLCVDASDPRADPRTAGYVGRYLDENRITAMLDVAIRFGGQNLGTLCFEHVDTPHNWEQHEIDFGCMVGAQLSVLMERRELRRAEDARREAQEHLRMTQELTALKSRFLANVSHEFRTPLTLLLGPVEDLLAGARGAPSPWQRDQLVLIRRSALRLLKLVSALLDFVRVEADRLPALFEPTDLVRLTRELVSLFESTAAKAGIALRVTVDPIPDPAYVDREMWERIVLNLVSNALKFTFAGQIEVSLRPAGDRIELAVRDTGIGIPAEALSHLFERFYRVPGTEGRTVEGAGIGLALVHDLVARHGGTIDVESAPGRGTTFRISIPRGHAHLPPARVRHEPRALAPPQTSPLVEEALGWLPDVPADGAGHAAPAALAAASPAGPHPARARILVADDNADMRGYLARLLGDRYDVEAVVDGVAAVEAARRSPPDLVLSDVMMPRLDGIGLLRALRADPVTSLVPVVLVSARAGEDAAVEALDVGADDYLAKPFSTRELLARVATHLELSQARREAAESALKDVFLAIAGHELRTPLMSLKLRIQATRRKLMAVGAAEAARPLAGVDRSIARLEELADALLSVSALREGRLSLRRERCDLVEIDRDAAAEESAALKRPVTLDLPAHPVEAWVDRERIAEVVKHLLDNAIKYSPRDRPVVLSLRDRGVEAEIAVRDEGPGIPPAEVPRIFERFYRAPGIEVQAGSRVGLGLGLYIARRLVEQHGGRITVETIPGQGSTFRVMLPRGIP